MTTLARWTVAAATAVLATTTAATANASFTQEPGSPLTVGLAPFGVLTADFNGDSLPDLATVNGSGPNVSVFVRQRGAGFVPSLGSPFTVSQGPNFGAVADFNRDGRLDIAASSFQGAAANVLLRQPDGTYAKEAGTPPTTQASAIAAADFNGDSYPDLAVAKWDFAEILVLLRKPGGGFQEEATIPNLTEVHPRYIAVADFNADGRPDLAVSNIHSDSVSILLRRAGGFDKEPGSPIKVGKFPVGVATDDITGDGLPDLTVANSDSGTVTVLARQRGGGFAPALGSPITVGANPQGVAISDFNRDGHQDLAVTNLGDNTVSVLLRSGDQFVPDGAPIPTGALPYMVGVADFNGDKKPDMAVSNSGTNTVTVLLNTTPDPVQPAPAPAAATNPGPGPQPPAPITPSINARLVLAWTLTKSSVKLTSATLRDLPAGGATVKLSCKTCKLSQTLTAKKTTLSLTKLVNKKLKRRATFTVTISKPGFNGLTFTRKVKSYGRSKSALRKAVKAPFSETRTCVPAASGARTC